MDTYKFPEVHLNNKLDWSNNMDALRKASAVVWMELDGVEAVTEERMTGIRVIVHIAFSLHLFPLFAELRQLRSTFSHRLIQPHASKRLGGSFIPSAIRLHITAPVPSDGLRLLP